MIDLVCMVANVQKGGIDTFVIAHKLASQEPLVEIVSTKPTSFSCFVSLVNIKRIWQKKFS